MEIQDAFAVVTLDREDFREDGLKAKILPFGLGHFGLEKLLIGIGLQFNEIWRSNDLFDFAEVNSFSDFAMWHLEPFCLMAGGGQPMMSIKKVKQSGLIWFDVV
jgi:hypothetical protein